MMQLQSMWTFASPHRQNARERAADVLLAQIGSKSEENQISSDSPAAASGVNSKQIHRITH